MKKTKSGFTLVELLMVMGIMGILMGILFQVFGSILSMKLRSEATTSVAQDSRFAISRLTYDISRASDIILPLPGSSGSILSLQIQGLNYVYELDGDSITLAVDGGASAKITGIGSSISALEFTRFIDLGTKKIVQINATFLPSTILEGGAVVGRQLITTVATR